MSDPKKELHEKRIAKVIKGLEQNRMIGRYIRSREELLQELDGLIADGQKVSYGGSMTLYETGVIDYLRNRKIDLLDRDCPDNSPEEVERCMAGAFTADVYLASTNAITEDGVLYNVDGRGNRVSAMVYGPKSVVLVVGYNKIVPDLDAAIQRVEKVAAPANTVRLDCATPCAKIGECAHCKNDARICCSYVAMAQQRVPGRVKVLLLDESLGY